MYAYHVHMKVTSLIVLGAMHVRQDVSLRKHKPNVTEIKLSNDWGSVSQMCHIHKDITNPCLLPKVTHSTSSTFAFTFRFSHLAETLIQSYLQNMQTLEGAII